MSDVTGPVNDDEGARILALLRDPNWQALAAMLTRTRKAAEKSLRKLDNSPERNGYWKGVIGIIEDITENIPAGIARQMEAVRELKKDED